MYKIRALDQDDKDTMTVADHFHHSFDHCGHDDEDMVQDRIKAKIG